ncbi:MAG: hypothetical protein AAB367_00240 [Patescibacteria group bacterium]
MKKFFGVCFMVTVLAVPLTLSAHASDEPHEEPPVAAVPLQTPAAIGGFLIGVAVGMVLSRALLWQKKPNEVK